MGRLVDIILNGKELDYEIEAESTVGDLIDGLSAWLQKQQGAVLVCARRDGRSFDPMTDTAVRALPAGGEGRLEFEAQNPRVLVRETVGELGQYLDRVARLSPNLEDAELTSENINQLLEGLSWSEDVLKRVEDILKLSYRDIEFEGEKLHKLLLRLGDLRDLLRVAYAEGNRVALLALFRSSVGPLCDSLVRALPIILQQAQLTAPVEEFEDELAESQPLVQGLPQRLEDIAVKISIGDQAQGMADFAKAIASLERAFALVDRCCREMTVSAEDLVVDGRSFEERNKDLTSILTELIEAFERRDRVLIGDLIEYEIAPNTAALATIMERLQNRLKGARH